MNPPPPAETDPARKKIIAAMDRLLDGTPLRSSGRLSISQLAIEADLGRWRLTHQHLDLKEQFQARVKANEKAASTTELSDYEALRAKHADLRAHCAELEQRLQLYAGVINLLVLEKQAADNNTPVSDLDDGRRRRRKPPTLIGPC
ncbi:hypothetical protein [Nocardia sp. NPDC005366]|uniref:hypothetical protein n=1 Tax=Nocardia sp. NPDC005366 TaxID=3156878 RepID=UPI0033A82630